MQGCLCAELNHISIIKNLMNTNYYFFDKIRLTTFIRILHENCEDRKALLNNI